MAVGGILVGCDPAPTAETGSEAGPVAAQRAAHDQGGRIIDLADALAPADEASLSTRLREEQQADGRAVTVALVRPNSGDSLERVGWAVGGSRGPARPLLLLVDPASAQVRIEGDLQPEARAAVASAMQPDLRAGRVAAAVNAGLDRLEQLAP